jgi:hypothetical protein
VRYELGSYITEATFFVVIAVKTSNFTPFLLAERFEIRLLLREYLPEATVLVLPQLSQFVACSLWRWP